MLELCPGTADVNLADSDDARNEMLDLGDIIDADLVFSS